MTIYLAVWLLGTPIFTDQKDACNFQESKNRPVKLFQIEAKCESCQISPMGISWSISGITAIAKALDEERAAFAEWQAVFNRATNKP